MKKVQMFKLKDSAGNIHYQDSQGNSYQPVGNEGIGNLWDSITSIFEPKEGGTVVGNLIRTGGSIIANVRQPSQPSQQPQQAQQPQYQQPQYQQPYYPAPAQKTDYMPWIIGGGLGIAALFIYLK